jgi:hypothetical protein
MKKLMLWVAFLGLSTATLLAQSPAAAPSKQKTEVAKTKTAEKQETKAATVSTGNPKAMPVKKDGTPDRRFAKNKHVKKDGTPDMRYKQQKAAQNAVPATK